MGNDHSQCPVEAKIPLPENENVIKVMKCCQYDTESVNRINAILLGVGLVLISPLALVVYGARKLRHKCMELKVYYINNLDGCELSDNKDNALQKYNDIQKNIRLEAERREAQKRQTQIENEANEIFKRGKSIWDDAWTEEGQDNIKEAENLFEQAKKLFQEAANLHPQNTIYQNAVAMAECKIKGNKLFNEGSALQMEGNRLRSKENYIDANKKFLAAIEKFAEGAQLDKDRKERFQECVEIVRESLGEIKSIIQSVSTAVKTAVFKDLYNFVKKHKEMIGVEESAINEETNIDVMYNYILDCEV